MAFASVSAFRTSRAFQTLKPLMNTRQVGSFTKNVSKSYTKRQNPFFSSSMSRIYSSNILGSSTATCFQRSNFSSAVESSLVNALNIEIDEFDAAEEPISIAEALGDSPFELKPSKGSESSTITLKNGHVVVTFDVDEFEHSGEQQTAVPMLVVVMHEESGKQLTFGCIARRNEETEEGELEIEEIVVENIDGGKKESKSDSEEETPYSPKIGELQDDLKTSFFEYLIDRGVDNDFAAKVALIAEISEENRYGKWLKDVKNFAVKESQ